MAFPYVNGASSAVSLTQRGSTWFFRAGPPTSTSVSRCSISRPRGCGRTSGQQDLDPSQRHPWGRCGAGTKTLATQVGYKAMADVAYDAASTTDLTS
jgi:hypothetical protein